MKLWEECTTLLRAVKHFRHDRALDLAAGVAFYALLSLGPVLYLIGATLSLLFDDRETGRTTTMSWIATFLPPEAVQAVERVMTSLRLEQGLVLLAAPALIWVGTTAISSLEKAVNVAFGSPPRRRIWYGRLKGFAILAVGWLTLGTTVLVNMLLPRLDGYRRALGLPEIAGGVARAGSYTLTLAMSFLVFLLFFKMLPRTRVSLRAAGPAALLCLVLWEAARHLFGSILLHSRAFGLLSGGVAGTVAFLLWIYTAVAIVLLGAEWAALVNGDRPGRPIRQPSGRGSRSPRDALENAKMAHYVPRR